MTDQPTHHGYAVNVKDHGRYDIERGPLSDEEVQAIYEVHQERFWDFAHDEALDLGFTQLFYEGREGGWAVPHPQPHDEFSDEELAQWMGDRFRPLEDALVALMEDLRDDFLADLADAVKRAQAEPNEAAYWAACDVVTIA
jgi:hypothetical protein